MGKFINPSKYVKSIKCVWATFVPQQIISGIGPDADPLVVAELDGEQISVKRTSLRLQTFKESIVCVGCGKAGVEFRAEQSKSDTKRGNRPHLNLYAADGMLMTHDHILARALGGDDSAGNVQTMCEWCNSKKGAREGLEVIKTRKQAGNCDARNFK